MQAFHAFRFDGVRRSIHLYDSPMYIEYGKDANSVNPCAFPENNYKWEMNVK